MTEVSANPRMFISYSWTTSAHEKWVLSLAEELVSQGIDVVLDKWHLKPGHDANAFMESMVTDEKVTKVLLVCDTKYAEKSDARTGGAGTEAQIITPQLYAKRDQEKFVAAVREKNPDGTPCLPVYYRGRIYFDLSDDARYAQEFEGLVRWAWDKPAYVMPEIGKRPAFLSDDAEAIKLPTSVAFRRAQDAVKSGRDQADALVTEYFATLASCLDAFRMTAIPKDGELLDDVIANNIEKFTPYRNEAIEMFISLAMYRPIEASALAIHRFLEQLEHYMRRPENMHQWREEDFDNFRFIVHELFLYAISVLIKYERFDMAAHIINTQYFTSESRNNPMVYFNVFRSYMRSFEARGQRLRRLSSRADLLRERCNAVGVEFRHLMAADFVLYLRSCGGDVGRPWWPETLVFATHHFTSLEIFARAKSRAYFEKLAPMLGVNSKADLEKRVQSLVPDRIPKWQFDSIDPADMCRLEELASAP